MQYADALAFPIPQHRQMQQEAALTIDPAIVLDACHVTTVPPFVTGMEDILRSHASFVSTLAKQYPACQTSFFYGLQHPPLDIAEQDLLMLKGTGIRFITLAYREPTEYGGGFASPDEPLTARGRWLIEAMGNAGLILDLSHAGHRTAREAIELVYRMDLPTRVVATHTGCHAVYPHKRNLP